MSIDGWLTGEVPGCAGRKAVEKPGKNDNHRQSRWFSLSKNYKTVLVSGIIEETGVFSWKIGEKMHGMSQS